MAKESVYFREGKLVAKSGDVRVYDVNQELFLEDGRLNLIASDQKLSDYIWQVGDKPFGNCLIAGMGLCISAKYVQSLPKIDKLTVVEDNKDIINVNYTLDRISKNLKVIHADYITFLYKTTNKYDFIFLDCYYKINITTMPYIADLVAAAKKALKSNGILIGWLDDNTSEKLIEPFYNLFNV